MRLLGQPNRDMRTLFVGEAAQKCEVAPGCKFDRNCPSGMPW
jgi:hypothetical protein